MKTNENFEIWYSFRILPVAFISVRRKRINKKTNALVLYIYTETFTEKPKRLRPSARNERIISARDPKPTRKNGNYVVLTFIWEMRMD